MTVDRGVDIDSSTLHGRGAISSELITKISRCIEDRIEHAPLGRTASRSQMDSALNGSITADGLGEAEAWRRFVDGVTANTVGLDSERFLAFIPVSPSAAGVWMDALLGAMTFSAESWLEAAGAVAAENQTLRWLADVLGMPESAGGCFMSGGSIGNLSALAVARDQATGRRMVAVADTAHASVFNSLHLLGLEAVLIPTTADGRMTAAATALAIKGRTDIGIIIAAGGSTNGGVVDDLAGLADLAETLGAWLHVDAAYGGAAMLVDECRPMFAGIERANSVVIDPHKWLFCPQGSCALLYKNPDLAMAVHRQHGPYLEVLHGDDDDVSWNPSDYGYQLTRRAAGLTLWFALAVHGVRAHEQAVRVGITLARYAVAQLNSVPQVTVLNDPMLSVVLFRRDGWDAAMWRQWAGQLLADGIAFVAPTTWRGETVGRLVFLHPRTPTSVVDQIVASLAE